MSWSEVKKINDNLNVPLNKLMSFTPSTNAARSALTDLGYTQRSTITSPAGTIYLFWKNTGVKSCSWDEAYEICTNWWKEINRWSVEQGYGNICIASRMPTYSDNTNWTMTDVWTGTSDAGSAGFGHYRYSEGGGYGYDYVGNSHAALPVVSII